MRRCVVATALVVLLTGCESGIGGRGEILSTPFPGTVLDARAKHNDCIDEGCPVAFRVRITNPTDRDANVQECALVEPPRLRLPLGVIPAGAEIRAHDTKTVMSSLYYLDITKEAVPSLVGQQVTCTGIDWHGNPPI